MYQNGEKLLFFETEKEEILLRYAIDDIDDKRLRNESGNELTEDISTDVTRTVTETF